MEHLTERVVALPADQANDDQVKVLPVIGAGSTNSGVFVDVECDLTQSWASTGKGYSFHRNDYDGTIDFESAKGMPDRGHFRFVLGDAEDTQKLMALLFDVYSWQVNRERGAR